MEPFLEKIPNMVGESFFSIKRISPKMNWGWHYHPEFELCFTEKGFGKRLVGNSIEVLEEDDLVFLGENTPHAFQTGTEFFKPENRLVVINIVIQFRKEIFGKFLHIQEMQEIKNMLEIAVFGLHITGALKTNVKSLMNNLLLVEGFDKLKLLLEILNLISTNLHDCRKLSTLKYSHIANPETSRITKVFQYIQSNFKHDISLQEIANIANLTPNAFCKYFKKRTNKSLIAYVNELRISYSCELLRADEISIKEIALLAGFKNRSNFNRQFFKVIGRTPSEFAKEYKTITVK